MDQIGTFYLKLRRFTVKMTDEAKKSTVHSFLRYQDEKTAIKCRIFDASVHIHQRPRSICGPLTIMGSKTFWSRTWISITLKLRLFEILASYTGIAFPLHGRQRGALSSIQSRSTVQIRCHRTMQWFQKFLTLWRWKLYQSG